MNRGFFGISNEAIDYAAPGRSATQPAILSGNTLVGYRSGSSLQGVQGGIGTGFGGGNTFFGYLTGLSMTTGDSNVFIGYNAAPSATNATRNIAVGYQAGLALTTAQGNTLMGYIAGQGITSGGNSTIIGYEADTVISSGGAVVAIGAQAGQNNFGSDGVYVGYQAGVTATSANSSTSGTGQTCIGYQSGQTASVAVSYITCLGYQTLVGAAGAVAIGTDHTGAGASVNTQDVIQMGTPNHTFVTSGKVKIDSHGLTAGSISTVQLSSSVATQIDTTCDRFTVTAVTYTPTAGAAATCKVQISADNVTYSTLVTTTVPTGTALDSFIDGINVMIPAGWYLDLVVTNATLGLTSYY